MESSRKFFQEKIGDHKDFSKKKFGRLYENKLKNLMRKFFTSEKQYQIKNLEKNAGAREAVLPVVAASPPPGASSRAEAGRSSPTAGPLRSAPPPSPSSPGGGRRRCTQGANGCYCGRVRRRRQELSRCSAPSASLGNCL